MFMSTGACNLSPDIRLTWKTNVGKTIWCLESRQNNLVSGFNWNYPDTLGSKVSYWVLRHSAIWNLARHQHPAATTRGCSVLAIEPLH